MRSSIIMDLEPVKAEQAFVHGLNAISYADIQAMTCLFTGITITEHCPWYST